MAESVFSSLSFFFPSYFFLLIFFFSLFLFFPFASITTGLMFLNIAAQRFNYINLRFVLGCCIFEILKAFTFLVPVFNRLLMFRLDKKSMQSSMLSLIGLSVKEVLEQKT